MKNQQNIEHFFLVRLFIIYCEVVSEPTNPSFIFKANNCCYHNLIKSYFRGRPAPFFAIVPCLSLLVRFIKRGCTSLK